MVRQGLYIQVLQISFCLFASKGEEFSYKLPNEWQKKFPECGGKRQSPIALKSSEAWYSSDIPPLTFINYDLPVALPVKAINNGHTIQIDLPHSNDEHFPIVYGGGLDFIYKVKGFHFHWGSAGLPGSEHSIDGNRFDIELHIVHKKIPYNTLQDARSDPFGILVLAVFFQGVQADLTGATDLNQFYDALPHLVEYKSQVEFHAMRMGQFINELNTEEFFMYNGSLTTPPCPEAAVWYVFPDILPIQYKYLKRFFKLRDSKNKLNLHNQRPIQRMNSRTVYYRRKQNTI